MTTLYQAVYWDVCMAVSQDAPAQSFVIKCVFVHFNSNYTFTERFPQPFLSLPRSPTISHAAQLNLLLKMPPRNSDTVSVPWSLGRPKLLDGLAYASNARRASVYTPSPLTFHIPDSNSPAYCTLAPRSPSRPAVTFLENSPLTRHQCGRCSKGGFHSQECTPPSILPPPANLEQRILYLARRNIASISLSVDRCLLGIRKTGGRSWCSFARAGFS